MKVSISFNGGYPWLNKYVIDTIFFKMQELHCNNFEENMPLFTTTSFMMQVVLEFVIKCAQY